MKGNTMDASKKGKKYLPPEIELLRLYANDILNDSQNIPNENIDENQGIWIS